MTTTTIRVILVQLTLSFRPHCPMMVLVVMSKCWVHHQNQCRNRLSSKDHEQQALLSQHRQKPRARIGDSVGKLYFHPVHRRSNSLPPVVSVKHENNDAADDDDDDDDHSGDTCATNAIFSPSLPDDRTGGYVEMLGAPPESTSQSLVEQAPRTGSIIESTQTKAQSMSWRLRLRGPTVLPPRRKAEMILAKRRRDEEEDQFSIESPKKLEMTASADYDTIYATCDSTHLGMDRRDGR
uniref:Uncharacterized protein n=1 Tax=Romanomermis culicivorax TaxID=13658 RepID=A0A915L1W7_ROMCU